MLATNASESILRLKLYKKATGKVFCRGDFAFSLRDHPLYTAITCCYIFFLIPSSP